MSYGSAIFVTIAQNIFSNKLVQGLEEVGINPGLVLGSGATVAFQNIPTTQIALVRPVFMSALKAAFTVPIIVNGAGVLFSLFLEKNMRLPGGMKQRKNLGTRDGPPDTSAESEE